METSKFKVKGDSGSYRLIASYASWTQVSLKEGNRGNACKHSAKARGFAERRLGSVDEWYESSRCSEIGL